MSEKKIFRTGFVKSVDATGQHHRRVAVIDYGDGDGCKYLVPAAGWCEVPALVQSEIVWDDGQLYASRSLPGHWVTYEFGEPVFWPARQNGWAERARYLGHEESLLPVNSVNAFGTGWAR